VRAKIWPPDSLKMCRLSRSVSDKSLPDLSMLYDIPIGLEVAQSENEHATYTIDFKKGTLSELLKQFVAAHDQYDWEIKDNIVNIFPKRNYRDPLLMGLLETNISSFTVKENTDCRTIIMSLLATQEIKKALEVNRTKYLGRGFSGLHIPMAGRHFTLNATNMTMKSILNKLIKDSPTVRFWFITRNNDDQTLFLDLNALLEGAPSTNGRIILR
jgi:hypothetical protein